MAHSKPSHSSVLGGHGSSRGYVLLELLISVVLLGVGVTAVLVSMRREAQLDSELDSRTRAIELLQAKLFELEVESIEGAAPLPGTEPFASPNEAYSWHLEILELPDWSSPAGQLWEFNISVSYPGKAKEEASSVTASRWFWYPSRSRQP